MPYSGKVDLKLELVKNSSKFHQDSITADVVLVVGKEHLVAHRFVLAAQSAVLRVLLYDQGFIEAKNRYVTIDAPLKAMKMVIEYAYTGVLTLSEWGLTDVADLLELCHRYELTELEKAVAEYLEIVVDAENARYVLQIASLAGHTDLEYRCWVLIDMIVQGIYETVEIELSPSELMKLLERTPRRVAEDKLYKFVNKQTHLPQFTIKDKVAAFSKINFVELPRNQLKHSVDPENALKLNNKVQFMREQDLKQMVVKKGRNKEFLFKDGIHYASHGPLNSDDNCILVDLGSLFIINCISFNARCGYSMEIQVSGNQKDWDTVVNVSQDSKGYKKFHFSDIMSQFLKVVGEQRNMDNKKIGFKAFKVAYVVNPPKFLAGFTIPSERIPFDLTVYNSKSKGNKIDIEPETGEVGPCRQMSKDYTIALALQQPTWISSFRFKLLSYPEGFEQHYSYTVLLAGEKGLSVDTFICESDDISNGWQRVDFSPRLINCIEVHLDGCNDYDEFILTDIDVPAQS